LPANVFVEQSVTIGGTSLVFSCTLLIELSASKSSLSMAFSKSSRSSLDSEHFNAMDVAFREIRAAWAVKFSFFALCLSTKYSHFAYFVHLFSIYCDGKIKTSFMLKTLRACLHNIPGIYGYHYSSMGIIKTNYKSKIKISIHTYRLKLSARTFDGHICSVEYNCCSMR
jgi:hypothetical protein